MINISNLKFSAVLVGCTLLAGVPATIAQTNNTTAQNGAQVLTVASGKKAKVKGIVVDRQADILTVRDIATGGTTQVRVVDGTKIKSKRFFGGGNTYANNLIIRGLNLEANGRGDASGVLVADRISFTDNDFKVAQSLDTRVAPVEGRLTETEQNAQKLSGQLDELVAISNAARGGARAAQDTADAAVQGVNATNSRISSLDDYEVQNNSTVNFKVGSSVLTAESKATLDTAAQNALATRGYLIEVTGYADASGNTERNRALSERRAETVRRYLVETHGIPLRRILQSYGYGEAQAVADNKTRSGRAENRRVELKVLVSKGLTQSVEVKTAAETTETTTTPQQ